MAVLIVGAAEAWAPAVVARLIAAGDDVRAMGGDAEAEERLRSLGAHIARGPVLDADLVERAAQNVRTVVIGSLRDDELLEVLQGARSAGVDRVVVVGPRAHRAGEPVRASGLDYVLLEAPASRFGRRGVAADEVATAVDAADDISGSVRLELDLRDAETWRRLGLTSPEGRGSGRRDR